MKQDDVSRGEDSFDKVRDNLEKNDEAGAREVFNRFANRLITIARQRMPQSLRQKVDPEDVVQSAFGSFVRGQAAGHFHFDDWESLWGLLLQITYRKCSRLRERFGTQRRNLHAEMPFSQLDQSSPIVEPLDHQPCASEIAILNETIDLLKEKLDPIELQILALRLEEHAVPEISRIVVRSERTVARTIQRIKNLLIDQFENNGEQAP